jgi:hypothetical protein
MYDGGRHDVFILPQSIRLPVQEEEWCHNTGKRLQATVIANKITAGAGNTPLSQWVWRMAFRAEESTISGLFCT